jgi:hypothetical protein
LLGARDDGDQPGRHLVGEIVLPAHDGAQARGQLGNDEELDAVDERAVLAPVGVGPRDLHLLVGGPAHDLPGAGSDRLAVVLGTQRLDGLGRDHHARAVGQDGRQGGVGPLQLHRHAQRAADLHIGHVLQVGLDVGAGVLPVAVEVELDGFGIQWAAIVEHDAGLDVQHHGQRVREGEAGQARLGLQRLVVPLDQGVEKGPQEGVVGARAAGGRIQAGRVGIGRDLEDAATLGCWGLRPCGTAHGGRAGDGAGHRHEVSARQCHGGLPGLTVGCWVAHARLLCGVR